MDTLDNGSAAIPKLTYLIYINENVTSFIPKDTLIISALKIDYHAYVLGISSWPPLEASHTISNNSPPSL